MCHFLGTEAAQNIAEKKISEDIRGGGNGAKADTLAPEMSEMVYSCIFCLPGAFWVVYCPLVIPKNFVCACTCV